MAKAKEGKAVIDLNAYHKALDIFNDALPTAVVSIAEIAEDPEINPATRLQACQTLLSNITKISEIVEKEELRLKETARHEQAAAQAKMDALRYKGMTPEEKLSARLTDMLNSF